MATSEQRTPAPTRAAKPPTPSPDEARVMVRGMLGAVDRANSVPTPTQMQTFESFATLVLGYDGDITNEQPLGPAELAAALADPLLRQLLVRILVILEFTEQRLAETIDESVTEYARALDVDEPMVHAAHQLAEHHTALMYADIQRHSWYNHEAARRVLSGHLLTLIRTKLAAIGGPEDPHVARRWRSLEGCPQGSWGRTLFDFYGANGFTLPGERRSIREVGAEHDWVHVLAEYDTSPEGEIDVFTFIAASTRGEEGLALLAATLSIFQTGTVHHIAGQNIPTATSGTLSGDVSMHRFVEAFARGRQTAQDVLNLDHFAWKDVPLVEARTRLNVVPRGISDGVAAPVA